nr:zinc-dependent alcohol dehydrogenase family protein [Streptomyces sp. NA04227]
MLRIEQVPLPAPGPGEALLRVEALGLNRAEALFRAGTYYYPPSLPGSRLGYEAAATVAAVGEGVGQLAVGDGVLTGPGIEMSAQGVYGDWLLLPADGLVRRPVELDPVTAAATWLTYSTAYGALVGTAGLQAGDHVLITAASSGVGIAALQTAARIGAIPIAVTRTAAKRGRLLDNGAAHVLVSEVQDVPAEARRITGGTGVDVVFDAIAGPGLAELAGAARMGGTVVVYGWLDGRPMSMPLNWPLTVHGYANQAVADFGEGRRRAEHFIASGLSDGSLRPVVGEVFEGLESMPEAHRAMERNEHVGKIVVTV